MAVVVVVVVVTVVAVVVVTAAMASMVYGPLVDTLMVWIKIVNVVVFLRAIVPFASRTCSEQF